MKCIKLTRDKFALVDDKDYGWINQWKWQAAIRGQNIYALRCVQNNYVRKGIYMHRLITDTPSDMQIDHINHNGLDNRRVNLRICSLADNRHNMLPKGGTSRHKGVFWNKKSCKWHVTIWNKGMPFYLGLFESESEAAIAYDQAAIELFGEFAYLNFPELAKPHNGAG